MTTKETEARTRTVDYYCMLSSGSDGGYWALYKAEIPFNTPEDEVEEAIWKAATEEDWGSEYPVGTVYVDPDEWDDDDYYDDDGTPTTAPMLALFRKLLERDEDARLSDARRCLEENALDVAAFNPAQARQERERMLTEIDRLEDYNAEDTFLVRLVPIRAEAH